MSVAFSGPQRAALPPVSQNFELVGKLGLETPAAQRTTATRDQALLPGQIADVAVYKNTAYVNSWAESTCRRGGFWSVDISDPANPKQLAFVPARSGQYHGEGAHVKSINIPGGFQGDVLAVNNEPCSGTRGGFDLYDVTNPAAPVTLIQSFGDRTADHAPDEPFGPLTGTQTPNSSHSIFIWQDGDKAYAVATDNTELSDVDIYDITDPRNPALIADVDLVELGIDQGIDVVGNSGNAEWIYNHDMVVKRINGVQTMLVSYWDAGYIKLDVSDPASPKIIGDSDFGTVDPLMTRASTGTPWSPEGNAHQAEFSHDNRFVLAADEDFDTHRFLGNIDQAVGGAFPFSSVGNTVHPNGDPYGPQIADHPIDSKARWVGRACNGDVIAPATADFKIAVVDSSSCAFQDKTENAEAAGYTAVMIIASSTGQFSCNTLIGMVFENYTGNAVTLWVPREVGLRMVGAYNTAQGCATPNPAAPKDGNPVKISAEFDGWGYTHLYRNDGATLTPIDAYAIDEAKDPAFATGFGDLSVHEWATDATENIAYSSYYSGGLRAFSFGDNGLEPTGKFIEQTGNDFWGVEQFTTSGGERLIAGSDRSIGLYIVRYTGPGAPVRPTCTGASAGATAGVPVAIPVSCSDANGNPLTLRAVNAPNGTVSFSGSTATYTPADGFGRTDTFTFVANDGAADSAPATVTVDVIRVVPVLPSGLKAGPCANDLLGTTARETLTGTSAGDRILGRAGNDVIRGNAGDDCILGEAGNDRLSGDAGNDDVDGGTGNDRVSGGDGTDEVAGGAGKDTVNGDAGNDRVTGGADADTLSGGAGRDRLDGGTGNDSVSGGSGNDTVSGGSGNDKLSAGAGTDTVRGGAGRDTINTRGGGRDTIDCGAGRDTVTADRTDKVSRNCEVVRRK